jgi:hypothetical protein
MTTDEQVLVTAEAPANVRPDGQPRKRQWPEWLRGKNQLDYLREEYGVELAARTLANKIAKGTGPQVQYFGVWRLIRPAWMDDWMTAQLSDARKADLQRRQNKDARSVAATEEADAGNKPEAA